MIHTFTIDDKGKRKRIRSPEDIYSLDKHFLKLIDDNGTCVCKRLSKKMAIEKLFK